MPTTVAPLGYLKELEWTDPIPPGDRPCDILFFGHASRRRKDFFARHAPFFSSVNARLIFGDLAIPRKDGAPGYYAGADRLRLVGSTRIILNVHSSERAYFETHRAMLAFANRCVLVTETSRWTAPLVNGSEFAMGALEDLPDLCQRYLTDDKKLQAVATAGYDYARLRQPMERTCRSLLDWVAVVDSERVRRKSSGVAGEGAEVEEERRQVIARLNGDLAARARGESTWEVQRNAAYERAGPPSISVLVTLSNYGRYVRQCLELVFRSQQTVGPIEIVVVDDASTDDSAARVAESMRDASIAVQLVRKRSNTGLADARNLGLECARGEFVFILDADNWIYPACLRVLEGAIRAGGFAAVYSLIRRFADESDNVDGALGLVSTFEWNVRELTRRPYIDAMAMLDRKKILSVGGYSRELIEHGWFGWKTTTYG